MTTSFSRNIAYHIVLVDDDKDDQLIFYEALQDIDKTVEVSIFNNGQDFLEALDAGNKTLPKIVFMDLNMPILNGMQCLNTLRKEVRYNDLSVIIYSTSGSEEDIRKTFHNGANRYMKKPNNFNVLKSLLYRAMSLNFTNDRFTLNASENYLLA